MATRATVNTIWIKRFLLASPLAVAAVLTVLINATNRFHLRREQIAGYCFLFGTPWAWLLDHDWFGNIHNRWLLALITHSVILWIPALLYTGCLWLLLRALADCSDIPA
jgi:hypothetical protein